MEPKFETVQLEGDSSFRALRFCCDTFSTDHDWHYHPECELTCILTGSGTRIIGDTVAAFSAGDVVLLGPNIPHCWRNDESEPVESNDLVVLQFGADCLGQEFLNLPEATLIHDLLGEASRGVVFDPKSSKLISRKMLELAEVSGLDRLVKFIELMAFLAEAEDRTYLASEYHQVDNRSHQSGRMAKVMAYLNDHLREEIKQSEVAEYVCMTPQGFSRFFRTTTGKTFVSFVNGMRIMEACQLLANSDADIVEIAFECGYSNLSNFNRRFLDIKGMTPREYRALANKRKV